MLEIGGNRAIDLIIAKESGLTGRRFGGGETAGKILGEHPQGGPIALKAGRYGPYVNHAKVNATLPKDADPTTFTLDEAVALLSAKASGGGGDGGSIQGRLLGEQPSRRADHRAPGTLRPLCQSRQDQRYPSSATCRQKA